MDQTLTANMAEDPQIGKCWSIYFIINILTPPEQTIYFTMREIHKEFQKFQSLYHKKKALVEALDLVLQGKQKIEEDLDATIKTKEESLNKKRKRAMEDNDVLPGQEGVSRGLNSLNSWNPPLMR